MDNEKNSSEKAGTHEAESSSGESTAPRARNRTVMLTPEITGQVRARLQQDLQGGDRSGAVQSPPPDLNNVGSSSFYTPGARSRSVSAPPVEPPAIEQPAPRARMSGNSVAAPQPPADDREGIVWQKKTPIVGFLVSFDSNPNGDVYDLRSGRLIITSEMSAQGNFLIVKDPSVSPMHAILRISNSGEIQVLDQLSEFGTRIKRFGADEEVELSGDKGSLEHGDVITFGNRKFNVCLIAMAQE